MSSKDILFVGPLPPPVNGFSKINERMLAALQQSYKVHVFDMSPQRSMLQPFLSLAHFIKALLQGNNCSTYIAFSGGERQWIDLFFIGISKLRGFPVYLHHHSFAYLEPEKRSKVLGLVGSNATFHIALCQEMANALHELYLIPKENIRIVSNASLLEAIPVKPRSQYTAETKDLRIGFLSNVTREKGIFEFLDIFLAKLPGNIRGFVAGPIAKDIEVEFFEALSKVDSVQYLGPVYGEDKERFFSDIDILLFPTKYATEAEPVTILEALARSVAVIAFRRGCIGGMVTDHSGAVIEDAEGYRDKIIDIVCRFDSDRELLGRAQSAARASFEQMRDQASESLLKLVSEIGESKHEN